MKQIASSLVLGLLALALVACGSTTRTAAVAAAGGAAAVVLNDQNAEAELAGSLAEVDRRTRAVLSEMGLAITKHAPERGEHEYEARMGDRVVHVKLEARSPTVTKVSVSSRRGTTLDYDVSHAREVVSRIQQQR